MVREFCLVDRQSLLTFINSDGNHTRVVVKDICDKVADMGDELEDVGDKVGEVGDKVEDVGDKVQCVDDKVQVVIEGARSLSSWLLNIFKNPHFQTASK